MPRKAAENGIEGQTVKLPNAVLANLNEINSSFSNINAAQSNVPRMAADNILNAWVSVIYVEKLDLIPTPQINMANLWLLKAFWK